MGSGRMSNDDDEVFGPLSAMEAMDADRLARIVGAAEARAKVIRQSLRTCAKCGKTMLPWPGRTKHFTCDPELPLVGRRCTCPPDCSDTHWGNGRVECVTRYVSPARSCAGAHSARSGGASVWLGAGGGLSFLLLERSSSQRVPFTLLQRRSKARPIRCYRLRAARIFLGSDRAFRERNQDGR